MSSTRRFIPPSQIYPGRLILCAQTNENGPWRRDFIFSWMGLGNTLEAFCDQSINDRSFKISILDATHGTDAQRPLDALQRAYSDRAWLAPPLDKRLGGYWQI